MHDVIGGSTIPEVSRSATLGKLLVVTGPPGAGKSTVARALADRHDIATVHVICDRFFEFVRAGRISPYREGADAQNHVVNNAILSSAAAFVEGGYFVIIDGMIGPWSLEPFREKFPDMQYLILRPSLETALARADQRGEQGFRNPAVIREVYSLFERLDGFASHIFDTSDLNPDETVEALQTAIGSNAYRLSASS